MATKILIVEDDANIADLLRLYLEKEGYQIAIASDGGKGVEQFRRFQPDLILLDLMLPKVSGYDLLEYITPSKTPVIIVSAMGQVNDRIRGLKMGADDYICKPYSLSVLLAKVKAELKRYESTHKDDRAEEDTNTVKLGSAVFDMKKASVIKDGKVMPLKAMEYKILVYLIRNSDRVIPKEEIFEKIWDTTVVGDVTLNVHIRHLREKIEDDAGDPRFIKTVWGVGFMLDTKGNP